MRAVRDGVAVRSSPDSGDPKTRSLLAVYLRDHLGGAMAGVSLVRRCRRANSDTDLDVVLGEVEEEIVEDRHTLTQIMARLGVSESQLKKLIGLSAEFVGRLKSNGRIFRYSPSSRVVELEVLAAGVFTKRNLWLSLRAIVDDYDALDSRQLDRLAARAARQYERLIFEHDRAAAIAFGSSPSPVPK